MNINFEANDTMKKLAGTNAIKAGSAESKAVLELLEGCNIPFDNDSFMLASYALQIGKALGQSKRSNRMA